MKTPFLPLISALLVCLLLISPVMSRISTTDKDQPQLLSSSPCYCVAGHRVGRLYLGVNNNGTFGTGYSRVARVDCFTGETVKSAEFPKNTNKIYLYGGALWIGAVVGQDTLVSVGADGWKSAYEMFPDDAPFGDMRYRSTEGDYLSITEGAVSHEDYLSVYTDTNLSASADYFGRPHRPLRVEISEASYAWSYPHTNDFVLFDMKIKNIGSSSLNEVYLGLMVDGDIGNEILNSSYGFDDISGFHRGEMILPQQSNPVALRPVAWSADNNGDYTYNTAAQVTSVLGTVFLNAPFQETDLSFNWWVSNGTPSLDFGPRERAGAGLWPEEFRDFLTGGLGTPEGDVNKYYLLRNREIDYDQVWTGAITPDDTLWMYPDQNYVGDIADGWDAHYLMSFGPLSIGPGESAPLTFAVVAGEGFHSSITNINNLPDNPQAYMDNISFADLDLNTQWAAWVYDTPGKDTDGDGYFGDYQMRGNDTLWLNGDGVPDWDADCRPVGPQTEVIKRINGLLVRFDGQASETTLDKFSHRKDFEGYNVYLSNYNPQTQPGHQVLMADYDLETYTKYVWTGDEDIWMYYAWFNEELPFTIDTLRCIYGYDCNNMSFDPLDYYRSNPLQVLGFPDSLFYFEKFGPNNNEFGVSTSIRKRYPDQPYPTSLNPALAQPDELTSDGRLKYFQYECLLDHLLPDQIYWVKTTAFDAGFPLMNLAPQESDLKNDWVSARVTAWPTVTATDRWISLYCDSLVVRGEPVGGGTTVAVYDPDGVLCGFDTVSTDGSFGFMQVYGDDPYSETDEGAEIGDELRVFIDDVQLYPTAPLIWTGNGDRRELCELSSRVCREYALDAGWHLISWNVDYSADASEFAEALNGCVDVIQSFEGVGLTFVPSLAAYSTLTEVDPEHGYWIRLHCPVSFEICGGQIEGTRSIDLEKGWNVVSYWPESEIAVADALTSLSSSLQLAYGFDNGYYEYRPDAPLYNTLEQMSPGFGYWIRSSSEAVLTYPGFEYAPGLNKQATVACDLAAELTTAPLWMSIYGSHITVDGVELSENSNVAIYDEQGRERGAGIYYDHRLKLTPVYSLDGEDKATAASALMLYIDGKQVYPNLEWRGAGNAVEIGRLSTDPGLLPATGSLKDCYPNPFNAATRIGYNLAGGGEVTLEVFNIAGQRVAVLAKGHQEAGYHEVDWSGVDQSGQPVASGIYFYRLKTSDGVETKKMVLLK